MWESMFGMDLSFAEKLLRTVALYAFLLLALRLSGKRVMAQLSTFDFIVLLLVSNAVQNGLIGDDNSVTGAMIGAAALFALNGLVALLIFRSRRAQRVIAGRAVTLVRDGKIDEKALGRQRFTMSDLMIELQNAGVSGLKDVRVARLEPNGQLLVTSTEVAGPSPADLLHALRARNEELEQSLRGLHHKVELLLAQFPPAAGSTGAAGSPAGPTGSAE